MDGFLRFSFGLGYIDPAAVGTWLGLRLLSPFVVCRPRGVVVCSAVQVRRSPTCIGCVHQGAGLKAPLPFLGHPFPLLDLERKTHAMHRSKRNGLSSRERDVHGTIGLLNGP